MVALMPPVRFPSARISSGTPAAEISTQGPAACDVTCGGRPFALSRDDTVTGTVPVSPPLTSRASVTTLASLEVFSRAMVL